MKMILKKTLVVLLALFLYGTVFAQEEKPAADTSSTPVRFTFGTAILIDNQTVATPYKGGLEFEIHHRFSQIRNYHDLFGIYGSANTRLGLNYGITDRIMVGIGSTKDYKLQDIQWKYLILRQTENNRMPVSLSYYGNFVIDLEPKSQFGPAESYRNIHRLSYFTQFILARKFSERISVQVAPSLTYYNLVPVYTDTTGYKNLNIGLSAGARINVVGAHSVILEYDQLLTHQDISVQPKPNLAFGWEINTATHTFQVFATNYSQIINQRNLVFNTSDFAHGGYMIGFNITVRF